MECAEEMRFRTEARRAAASILIRRPEVGESRFFAFPNSGYVRAFGRELRAVHKDTGMTFRLFSEGKARTPDRERKKCVMVTRTK